LNLFWLKYVSWALLVGAAFFYFMIRLNKLALSVIAKATCYSACIVLACIAWHVQAHNVEANSPRRLVVGTVTMVKANHGRNGNVYYAFQLRRESGANSQPFNTGTVSSSDTDNPPIHVGDLLGVLYREWDGIPVRIDEIHGQRAGWNFSYIEDGGGAFIFGVLVGGLFGLVSAIFNSRRLATQASQSKS
jgi:hypothetical protein